MFTVALIGPDGVGKTTVCRQLERTLPLPAKYVYMGVNLAASDFVLPTTRLICECKRLFGKRPDMAGPPDPTRVRPRPTGTLRRVAAGLKSALRLANQMAEEWFRQTVVWHHVRRGTIVLFDRHFFSDYFAYDIEHHGGWRPLSSRIHGFHLNRLYPKPNLVILLDAPAELLFARKGEGTVELLDRRLQEYRRLRRVVQHFHTVDASQPLADVTREVTNLILEFYQTRGGHALKPRTRTLPACGP